MLLNICNLQVEDIKLYQITTEAMNEKYKSILREDGDFENYYGMQEKEEIYEIIDLRKPLYFSIFKDDIFIGYIGFSEEERVLEPEIYIYKPYRNKGYGSKILSAVIEYIVKNGLTNEDKEKVDIHKFKASVLKRNYYSQKMLETCGFVKMTSSFNALIFGNENGLTNSSEIVEYIKIVKTLD